MTPLRFTHVRLIPGTLRGHCVAFDGKTETHIGYTLENAEKRIPPGVYKVGLHRWTVNGKLRAHLLDVPGRSYILVHELNRPSQSLGCIGTASGVVRDSFDWIVGSTAQKVADMVSKALEEGREVTWEVIDSVGVR